MNRILNKFFLKLQAVRLFGGGRNANNANNGLGIGDPECGDSVKSSVAERYSEDEPDANYLGNLLPMDLCDVCQKMSTAALLRAATSKKCVGGWLITFGYYQHHPGAMALFTAAANGCDLCSLFVEGLAGQSTPNRGRSIQDLRRHYEEFILTKKFEPPCLIKVGGPISGDGAPTHIEQIEFSIPKAYIHGDESLGWNTFSGARAKFWLSSLPGPTNDCQFRELALLPDFNVARKWILECTTKHPKCVAGLLGDKARSDDHAVDRALRKNKGYVKNRLAETEEPQLPTRVIDVSIDERKTEPRLLISENRRAQYAALSHCWGQGDRRPLQTTSTNFKEHEKEIPFSTLPKTFQDAVIATRELGLRYLWIDSLCIIQDSPEDWQVECSKMAGIYRYSSVTIIGAMASDSHDGFLQERVLPDSIPLAHLWEYKNSQFGPVSRALLRNYAEHVYGYEYHHSVDSPLGHRGWILQEQLLSPRLLYFGPRGMYAECNTNIYFEGDRVPSFSKPYCQELNKSKIFPLELFQTGESSRNWETWYQVVEKYSKRHLTYPRDKLPAISGLAKWLLGDEKNNYVAGLLKDDIFVGLSWRMLVHQKVDHNSYLDRGPSWSWISTNNPCDFQALPSRVRSTVSNGEDSEDDSKNPQIWLKPISKHKRMKIHDIHLELLGHDPFGEIKSCSLKIKGKFKEGMFKVINRDWGRTLQGCNDFDAKVWKYEAAGECMDFWPDHEDAWLKDSKKQHKLQCLCVEGGKLGWYGLIVEPFEPGNISVSRYKPYRRTGFISHKSSSKFDFFWDASWELIELF